MLEQAFDHVVIAESESIEQVGEMTNGDSPDVVIIDPWRAGVDVGEIVGRLRDELKAPIVVFTSDGGARLLSEALKAGVKGYVRKDSPSEDLVRAIEAARDGEFYVDPGLSSTIVLDEGDRTLSARQREILQLVAEGRSMKEIAFALKLSVKTVETHRRQVMERLQIFDVPGLVRFALRHGIVRE